MATPLTVQKHVNAMHGAAFFTRLGLTATVYVSVVKHVTVTSQVRVLHRFRWKCNCS